jgi:hypothetical protein
MMESGFKHPIVIKVFGAVKICDTNTLAIDGCIDPVETIGINIKEHIQQRVLAIFETVVF